MPVNLKMGNGHRRSIRPGRTAPEVIDSNTATHGTNLYCVQTRVCEYVHHSWCGIA